MGPDGFVPIDLVCSFRKMTKLGATAGAVIQAVHTSSKVHVGRTATGLGLGRRG